MADLRITVDEEMGYKHSLKALWINFHDIDSEVNFERMTKRAMSLCANKGIDSGELKFLSMITVNLTIDAPLSWWSHYDTYKVGVVMSSESKMHSLRKTNLCSQNDVYSHQDSHFIVGGDTLLNTIELIKKGASIDQINDSVPLGFMQGRVITTNYLSIARLVLQRKDHTLHIWKHAIDSLLSQLEHKELILAITDKR